MTLRLRLACAVALAFPAAALAQLDVAGLDKSIDPCADFYRFTNRAWLESTKIPDDRTSWGTFSVIDQRNEKILEGAFREALAGPLPPESTAKGKVFRFYRSGMDIPAIDKAGLAPLEPLFHAIDAVESREKLVEAIALLQSQGVPAGFGFGVDPDRRDSSRYLVQLSQGGLGMPDRDYYFLDDERSKKLRAGYVAHVEKMFALAGEPADQARQHADRVMAFETALARDSSTRTERRDPVKNYNKMTVAELSKAAPGFPWRGFLDRLGARVDEVDVQQPRFFTAFGQAAATRPVEDWKAYLRWNVLAATATKLPERFEAEAFDFNERQVKGTKALASRHRRVILAIGGPYGAVGLGHAVGQVYVEKAFPPEAKARALELVDDVKDALRDRLRHVDWMSPDTRAASLGKLDAMDVKIGYPDRWRDFSDAHVGDKTFVENWLASRAFDVRREVAHLGQPVDKTEWLLSPHIVNAYYNRSANEIVFPAAILQPPYFDARADDAYNYGGIGMVIGHEITHGFDDTGRQFDAKGNMREWWTPEDAKRYNERAQRAVVQYNAYEGPEGTKTNGQLTLGENLADVGGLKIAYDALQRALRKHPQGSIQGLTPEQRFFVAFSQDWRSVIRPEYERNLLLTDVHSLPRYRVRGPLMQLPEFAKAFSCDAKQALLPDEQRTNIW